MKAWFGKAADFFLALMPHVNCAMAVVMLTLLITDRFNRAMAFINNDITKGMLIAWCVLLLAQAVLSIFRKKSP